MRKPRDFDAELKMLADKAKALRERRVRQLGELVATTGADALDADLLAGALLHVAAMKDTATKEGWRSAGAAFFRGNARKPAPRSESVASGGSTARRRRAIALRHERREPTCVIGPSSAASARGI